MLISQCLLPGVPGSSAIKGGPPCARACGAARAEASKRRSGNSLRMDMKKVLREGGNSLINRESPECKGSTGRVKAGLRQRVRESVRLRRDPALQRVH